MGLRSYDQSAKEMYRVTFNVPGVAGNYASETITFGQVGVGTSYQFFREVSALVEQAIIAGAVVELWLPQIPDGSVSAAGEGPGTYWNTNVTPLSTQALGRWQFSAWPGAQLRVKSGGNGGALTISASAF